VFLNDLVVGKHVSLLNVCWFIVHLENLLDHFYTTWSGVGLVGKAYKWAKAENSEDWVS
jgi:hypothetical protein